jgi:hypothetical protein
MQEKAVIDRIVDGQHAVLLVGESEEEIVLPVEQLPAEAGAGMWLRVEVEDGVITEITVDDEETEAVRQRIAGKMALLRGRGGRLRRKGEDGEGG